MIPNRLQDVLAYMTWRGLNTDYCWKKDRWYELTPVEPVWDAVDETEPASPHVYHTTITPRALDVGVEGRAGFRSSSPLLTYRISNIILRSERYRTL